MICSLENFQLDPHIEELRTKGFIYKGPYSLTDEIPEDMSVGDIYLIEGKEYICTGPMHLEELGLEYLFMGKKELLRI